MLALICSQLAIAQVPALESAVKATYVVKFPAFVEWPSRAFAAVDSPLVVCVVGEDTVGKLIEEAAGGQVIESHPVVVRRMSQEAALDGCHAMYVAGLREQAVAGFLEAVRGKPVLTITDSGDERKSQGVINFVVRDNRVRFEIDLEKAAQQRLSPSSKLVSLAIRVRPRDIKVQ